LSLDRFSQVVDTQRVANNDDDSAGSTHAEENGVLVPVKEANAEKKDESEVKTKNDDCVSPCNITVLEGNAYCILVRVRRVH
jgi:hypothetical protein